jgi:small subunit ribosomal protein S16
MAVRIRLQRFGSKKRPYYRIVSADGRAKRDGRYLEQVGTYNPMLKPHHVTFKEERMAYWLSVGAQPSDTVASLYRKYQRENTQVAEA